jgi:hypothetical protein
VLEVNPTEMRPPRPALTVVMPARNEASRLPGAVEHVGVFLAAHGSAELVVAADVHSHDRTFAVAEARPRATRPSEPSLSSALESRTRSEWGSRQLAAGWS